jgi:hypothetical protein
MRKSMLIVGVLGTSALLNGCVMAKRGMSKHGNDRGANAHGRSFAKVVKEFVDEDLALSLEVPPLSAGQEATLRVRAYRVVDAAPISGASVTFEIKREEQNLEAETTPERTAAMVAEGTAEEVAANKGEYSLRFIFEGPGSYQITARVRTADKNATESQSVSLRQVVSEQENRPHKYWLILGGITIVKVGLLIFVL